MRKRKAVAGHDLGDFRGSWQPKLQFTGKLSNAGAIQWVSTRISRISSTLLAGDADSIGLVEADPSAAISLDATSMATFPYIRVVSSNFKA
ncbi:hypothetical protein RJ641_006154 [Dillenia turbinata]|uniref:Uncharacterized protein n=1 Tax=Dillenia turbinata TaxID=194707 RepID=A0AAN8V339_9MAGN